MTRDFTYRVYSNLLETGLDSDYTFLTVKKYLSQETTPERSIILRHDIDRKPENALDMARIEADAGISSTYYFRAIPKTFKPDIFQEIEELGHEVGYHYEDLDQTKGDVEAAHEQFASNLERFQDYVTVVTISMHGNPLTSQDNREMWADYDFGQYGLIGEVYLSFDFTEVTYFTDTNRTWYDEKTMVNDWPVGESKKPMQINTTWDLMEIIENQQIDRFYILTHPNRWADTYSEWVAEVMKDTVINAGKYVLWLARRMRKPGKSGEKYV
jgi:hypothetical protein